MKTWGIVCHTDVISENKRFKKMSNHDILTIHYLSEKNFSKQKQKYRGMFETQKSGNKTSSGDIGLNIRTFASPKVGQDQIRPILVSFRMDFS